jgi:hypothetical protein
MVTLLRKPSASFHGLLVPDLLTLAAPVDATQPPLMREINVQSCIAPFVLAIGSTQQLLKQQCTK